MSNHTIYVSDDSLWRMAKRYAKRNGISMSTLIMRALREYIVDVHALRMG